MNTAKRRTNMSRIGLCVMYLLVCCFVWIPNAMADQVDTDGNWEEGRRSITQDCPVTVTYDEAFLYIETTSARSDIQIRILDGVTVVYEATLYAPDTFIAIPLEQLEDGTYGLELTNQWGDYLYGEFEK